MAHEKELLVERRLFKHPGPSTWHMQMRGAGHPCSISTGFLIFS